MICSNLYTYTYTHSPKFWVTNSTRGKTCKWKNIFSSLRYTSLHFMFRFFSRSDALLFQQLYSLVYVNFFLLFFFFLIPIESHSFAHHHIWSVGSKSVYTCIKIIFLLSAWWMCIIHFGSVLCCSVLCCTVHSQIPPVYCCWYRHTHT